jgi:sugar lactone lactonase YvrE
MYNGPIAVAGTLNIKALAVAPGYLTGDVASGSYTVTSYSPLITTVAKSTGDNGFLSQLPALPFGQTRFANLSGVAVDKAGNAYFSDAYNAVVWMQSAKTGKVTIFAGTGTSGSAGDGGPASQAELSGPVGLAIDKNSNVYIADSANRVIRKVAADTGTISIFAGIEGGSGLPTRGDGGPATEATFISPQNIAFDSSGNLYISDAGDGVVRKVSGKDGTISTVAGTHGNLPTPPAIGDGGPATSAYLGQPGAVGLDSKGDLYIACMPLGRVRKVDATGIITTVAGNGNPYGSSGDGGSALAAEVTPNGLAIDGADNVYISNASATIRKFDPKTGKITRAAGIGLWGSSGDGNAALVAQIANPGAMAFESSGNMFFTEGEGSIRKVLFTASPTATPVIDPGARTSRVRCRSPSRMRLQGRPSTTRLMEALPPPHRLCIPAPSRSTPPQPSRPLPWPRCIRPAMLLAPLTR